MTKRHVETVPSLIRTQSPNTCRRQMVYLMTVTRFSQQSGSAGKSIVMIWGEAKKSSQWVTVWISGVHGQAQARLQYSSGENRGQVP